MPFRAVPAAEVESVGAERQSDCWDLCGSEPPNTRNEYVDPALKIPIPQSIFLVPDETKETQMTEERVPEEISPSAPGEEVRDGDERQKKKQEDTDAPSADTDAAIEASWDSTWSTAECEVELEGSIWVAPLLVGTKPVGAAGSALLVMLLCLNLLVQLVFAYIVFVSMTSPEYEDSTVDALRNWRRDIAHNIKYVVSSQLAPRAPASAPLPPIASPPPPNTPTICHRSPQGSR